MKLIRWFKANGEDREFKYVAGERDKTELQWLVAIIKEQGDIYRITNRDKAGYYHLYDCPNY